MSIVRVIRRSLLLALVIPTLLAPSGALARTTIRTLKPWTADGHLEPAFSTIRRSGTCETESFKSTRSDAWRCFTGNFIRDPCFESPTEEIVACLDSPWDRRAVLVRTTLDPDNHGTAKVRHPWALTLARRRCTFLSGATTVFANRRLNYLCGRRGPYLFGLPRKNRPTWTILTADTPDGDNARRLRIRVAWR